MLPPQGFQKASILPRDVPPMASTSMLPPPRPSSSTTSTLGSNRNASGGLPPVPKFTDPPIPALADPTGSGASISATSDPAVTAPETSNKPVNRPMTSKNAILYHSVQRKNPVLKEIKGVGVEISDITADYQVGTHNGVLFLSLKYHRLHPEYIHGRIEKMKNKYNVRILLILCDIGEHQQSIRELSKTAIINDFAIFVAWSNEEVAEYLTTMKKFEHKSANILKEKVHQSYPSQLHHVLTSGKKVSKTDASNLSSQFGSFHNIVNQPLKVLSNVKGLGSVKVTSLVDAFNKPFLVGGLKRAERGEVSASEGVQGDGNDTAVESSKARPVQAVGSPEWEDDGATSPPGEDGKDTADLTLPRPEDEAEEDREPSSKRARVEE